MSPPFIHYIQLRLLILILLYAPMYIITTTSTCVFAIAVLGNMSQYWRVSVFKDIVKETDRIHQVEGYNVMADRWMFHLGNKTKHHYYKPADCTHYTVEGSDPVVKKLKDVVIKYTIDKQKLAREAIHGKNYKEVLRKRHTNSAMLPVGGS